jgi:GNAT superfamily N-acetyltransferase
MAAPALDLYLAGFAERCAVMGGAVLDEPGLSGLAPAAGEPSARLLVCDDRAYERLAAMLPELRGGVIRVLAAAPRCRELVAGTGAWEVEEMTAMLLRDLAMVPERPLAPELTLRPVRRRHGEDPSGVPLEAVVAAAVASDPTIVDSPAMFTEYLRNVPPAFRLFAAVDAAGEVRATSGVGIFATQADVIFVNTLPGWRGRGIGQAMTAAALLSARELGAGRAALDATDDGMRLYLRLGFEVVSRTTHFFREMASG